MKTEEHFRRVLRQAVANRPSTASAWDGFRRRSRYRRRVRFVALAGSALAIAAAAGGFTVIVRDNGTVAVPQQESNDPFSGWATFESGGDELPQLRFRHPANWTVESSEEGGRKRYRILLPRAPATAGGENSFAITIILANEGLDAAHPEALPADAPKRPDGRPYLRSETERDGSREVTYRISWMSRCAYHKPFSCTVGQDTLVVRIISRGESTWQAYGATGERLVASIDDAYLLRWPVFRSDSDHHFEVKYPPAWRIERRAGGGRTPHYEILPPGQLPTTTGDPTFVITISHLKETLDPTRPDIYPPKASQRADGRPFIGSHTESTDGKSQATFRISWMPPCAYENPGCEAESATLLVRVVASNLKYSRPEITDEWIVESFAYV